MSVEWEEIYGFRSLGEFERFETWISKQVEAHQVFPVRVAAPYTGATTFQELWFRHSETGETWRLVSPDAPFAGLFEPVQLDEQ
ncbi:hypothetical protein ASG47_19805 [Devosia sp. Leaf420]|uniref:hypothetical protein n=1 Tax=Devosia sp. Leaf420 TaxID=1736374 RepID=UPI00071323FE|nr:hypothetical protein [Devosia sp. Leaf420]KQT50238.1 hypothetical protein ASG47_19805 [Devosia sp. Leaf420]